MVVILTNTAIRLVKRTTAKVPQSLSKNAGQKRKSSGNAPKSPGKPDAPSETSIEQANEGRASSEVKSKATWPRRLGFLTDAAKAYERTQQRRPWATQLGASLSVYLCGDMLAQYIDGEGYNPYRTLRHLTVGAGAAIPGYTWFMYLGRHFNYSSQILSLATKVVVNQIVFTPIFNSYFFSMQSLLSGASVRDAYERVKNTLPTSFINSCKLWPAVTAFSFTYIQPQFRFLFAGAVAVGWQSYLSWLNQRAAESERNRLAGTIALA